MAEVVIDASALVDLLLDNDLGRLVRDRLAGQVIHAPAHLDAEVLSALGRLYRAGELDAAEVESKLHALNRAPIERHAVADLLVGAWVRRDRLRLVDAVYVELAESQSAPLITTDRRLHGEASADVVTVADASG